MKLFKYNSSAFARIVFVFTFLVNVSFGVYGQENNGWGEDAWGAPDTAAVAEKVYTLDDYTKTVGNGEKVYSIYVKNVSDEVIILRDAKMKSIKLGDVDVDPKSVKVNILVKGVIRVLPGEQRDLISVIDKPDSDDLKFNWGYTYNTVYASEPVTGKPTSGIDYAVYSKVDSSKKRVDYFIQNFSDRVLIYSNIQEFTMDDFGSHLYRNSVSHSMNLDAMMSKKDKKYFKFKTRYSGPKKPTVLKPGEYRLIWRDSYLYYDDYPLISPIMDIVFAIGKP